MSKARSAGMLKLSKRSIVDQVNRIGADAASDFRRDRLLSAATAKTGLTDFGGDEFLEGLDRLLESYARDADLTFVGRISMRQDAIGMLVNRLRLQSYRRQHPAIAAERVATPIFIIGLPRTGTTFLHGLLSQDPRHRSPLGWEVMFLPTPGNEHETRVVRRAHRRMKWIDWLSPGIQALHEVDALVPQECIAITGQTFESYLFQSMCNVSSYQAWLENRDLTSSYAYHRTLLQHLQHGREKQGWILKTPAHLFAIRSILEVYPEARFVQTHRDPCRALASLASLTVALRRAFSDNVNPRDIGQEVVDRWSRGIMTTLELRRSNTEIDALFFDVAYDDLEQRPLWVIERLYNYFGLSLDTHTRERIHNYLLQSPRHKHGSHDYAAERYGIDRNVLSTYRKAYSLN